MRSSPPRRNNGESLSAEGPAGPLLSRNMPTVVAVAGPAGSLARRLCDVAQRREGAAAVAAARCRRGNGAGARPETGDRAITAPGSAACAAGIGGGRSWRCRSLARLPRRGLGGARPESAPSPLLVRERRRPSAPVRWRCAAGISFGRCDGARRCGKRRRGRRRPARWPRAPILTAHSGFALRPRKSAGLSDPVFA